MALASTCVFEVETTGADTNGGLYDGAGASPGTDYSYGAGMVTYSYTDLAIQAGNNTQLTSASRPFVAADNRNGLQITAGAAFTQGIREMTSVGAGVATMDAAVGTAGSAGGSGTLGGALASIGKAFSAAVASNIVYAKTGSYNVTSATANVAGGCISMPAGTAAANPTSLIGYGTTRGDRASRPTFVASGISTFTLITAANGCWVENVILDGASLTSSRGMSWNSSSGMMALLVKVQNFTNSGMLLGGVAAWCEASNISGGVGIGSQGVGLTCTSCVVHDSAVSGFQAATNGCVFDDCVSYGSTSTVAHGFNVGAGYATLIGCVAYNNQGRGFRIVPSVSAPCTLIGCMADSNLAFGYELTSASLNVLIIRCAARNNTSGDTSNAAAGNLVNFITGVTFSGSPFVNPAGLDFSLNNTPGAGAVLRTAGYPGNSAPWNLPGTNTPNYMDIGAAQHRDVLTHPGMRGRMSG